MKFLLKYLIVFLIVFLGLKSILYTFDKGHTVNYNIGNFSIKEIYTTKDDNYYFEIKSDDLKTNFQIKHNYKKDEKIIKKLEYKKIDEYDCLLPIFKEKQIITDIMCTKDNTIYYANILNNEKIYKEFTMYDRNEFTDKAKKINISNTQSIYKDNILKNTYMAIETYKGVKLFNGKESEIKLFDNDIYKKPISTFTDKYYLVADYNSNYSFKNIHVVNIINGEKMNIRSYDDISFDSYIMGTVDNKTYLFDKESNKQYEIDLEAESINQIGNKNNIKYYDGNWKTITLKEAKEEKKFTTSKPEKGYEKTDKINNYYYFYKKENDITKVYRSDKNNKKIKTYLFETTDTNNITYIKDKVYYKNKNTYYLYNECTSKKLISDTELDFNNDISFGSYEK